MWATDAAGALAFGAAWVTLLSRSRGVDSLWEFILLGGVGWACFVVAVRSLLCAVTSKAYTVHRSGAVVISGASSGIGRAAALALDARGFTVYAGVRKEADANSLIAERKSLRPILLDVSDSGSVERAAARVARELRGSRARSDTKLVAVVNNAGVSRGLPVELEDIDSATRVVNVNLIGVLRMCRAFVPLLRASRGRIINIGSVNGTIATRRGGVYAATKFGVEGLTDALRLEMNPFGVAVACVRPGYVRTSIARKQLGEDLPWKDLPREKYNLYKALFDKYPVYRARVEKTAASTAVTDEAIVHAVTSRRPNTRYEVASVSSLFTAWGALWAKWLLPDRVFDKLV